jgi:anti-sigma-K factor RskA
MSGHEQFAEDLALHALGVLEGDERAHLEEHLNTCVACRLELEQLRGDGALLALSTVGPKPPQRARKKLLDAVARDAARPTPSGATAARPRSWWGVLGWALAAVALVFAVLLWRQNSSLRTAIEDSVALRRVIDQQRVDLARARDVVSTLTATDAMRVTLVAAKRPPQPQGKAIYERSRGTLVFMANNLPSLPAKKAYQLWLIPRAGKPIPAGVFKPDAHGSATVINPPLPRGTVAKAFAITVEDEAGASIPTMPIVMMGESE